MIALPTTSPHHGSDDETHRIVRWIAVFQLPFPLPAHSNHSSTSRLLSGSFGPERRVFYVCWFDANCVVNLWIPVIVFRICVVGVEEVPDNIQGFIHVNTCNKISKAQICLIKIQDTIRMFFQYDFLFTHRSPQELGPCACG